MGNCVKHQGQVEHFNNIFLKTDKIIEKDDLYSFQLLSQSNEFKEHLLNIDHPYFNKDLEEHNLLTLTIYHSAFEVLNFVHSQLSASFELADKLLSDRNSSLLDLICSKGDVKVLTYYLPHHKSTNKISFSEDRSFSLFDEPLLKILPKFRPTPIQKSCEAGNIPLIQAVLKHFKDQKPPAELDVHYQEQSSGENCALVACRSGNFLMIKFLHQTCHSNFRLLNKSGENAVQILAARNLKKALPDFHECLVYLVNHAGVDIKHNYEETILLVQCARSIMFLEKKLKDKGVEFDKEKLEDLNKIEKVKRVKTAVDDKIEETKGKQLKFCDLYNECFQEDDEISCIERNETQSVFFWSNEIDNINE